jgi:hypothetical protein
VACSRCKIATTKCSDYRPCKKCCNSKKPCTVDGDIVQSRNIQATAPLPVGNSFNMNPQLKVDGLSRPHLNERIGDKASSASTFIADSHFETFPLWLRYPNCSQPPWLMAPMRSINFDGKHGFHHLAMPQHETNHPTRLTDLNVAEIRRPSLALPAQSLFCPPVFLPCINTSLLGGGGGTSQPCTTLSASSPALNITASRPHYFASMAKPTAGSPFDPSFSYDSSSLVQAQHPFSAPQVFQFPQAGSFLEIYPTLAS